MDGDEVEVHKHAEKEQGQHHSIFTEQGWSIKSLICGQSSYLQPPGIVYVKRTLSINRQNIKNKGKMHAK